MKMILGFTTGPEEVGSPTPQKKKTGQGNFHQSIPGPGTILIFWLRVIKGTTDIARAYGCSHIVRAR